MKTVIHLFSFVTLMIAASTVSAIGCSGVTEPMSSKEIYERIKPAGEVTVAGGGAAKPVVTEELGADAGEKRYKASCAVCHEAGVAAAPKFRNAAEWKPRMSVGVDGLLKSAIAGKGAMPPKGTCMQCSDKELRMAIEYMLPK